MTPPEPIDDPAALLAGSPSLLADLPEADRQALAEVSEVRRFARGEFLFQQGQRANCLYAIIDGTVKVHRVGNDGREQILHCFGPGELVGEVPVFSGASYPAHAAALEAVTAVAIPRDEFLELGTRNPQILLDLLAVLATRLRRFVHLIDDLALKEVGARLARHLLDLAQRQGSHTVELPGSKALLAASLGTIAETLSRTLGKLQGAGLINVERRSIRLLDLDGLQEMAEGM